MRTVSTGTIATTVIALLAAAATGATVVRASTGGPGCASSWRLVTEPATPGSYQLNPSPDVGDSSVEFAPQTGLVSQSVLGGGDAWFSGINGYDGAPWTLHWNGRTMSPSATLPMGPYFSGDSGYTSFDSDGDGWMLSPFLPDTEPSVGNTFEHWHGGHWTMVQAAVSPAPVKEDVNLSDVVAISPDDAWAVGEFDSPQAAIGVGPMGALTEHWNGESWSVVPNPVSSASSALLLTVTAVSADDVWAVGQRQTGGDSYLPLVEHFDGSKWTVLPTPALSAGSTAGALSSLTATGPDSVWAGGLEQPKGSLTQAVPVIEHWNGTRWSVQVISMLPRFPWQQFGFGLAWGITAIYAASPADIWAAATYQTTDQPYNVPYFVHWNGHTWTTVPMPGPKGFGLIYTYSTIGGIGPGDIWAAGSVSNEANGTVTPQIAHLGCAS